MRTTIYLKGGWSFTVRETAEQVEDAMTQPGPFGMLAFEWVTSVILDRRHPLRIDAHSIVAVSELPDE